MADKTIGDLTQATELNDDALLVAEQNGEAVRVAASSLKSCCTPVRGTDYWTEDDKQEVADDLRDEFGSLQTYVEKLVGKFEESGDFLTLTPALYSEMEISIEKPDDSPNKGLIYRTGENLINLVELLGGAQSIEKNGVTLTINEDSTYTLTGTHTSTGWTIFASNGTVLSTHPTYLPAGTYTAPRFLVNGADCGLKVGLKTLSGTTVTLAGTRTMDEPFYVASCQISIYYTNTFDHTGDLALYRGTNTSGDPVYNGESYSTDTEVISVLAGTNNVWTVDGTLTVTGVGRGAYEEDTSEYDESMDGYAKRVRSRQSLNTLTIGVMTDNHVDYNGGGTMDYWLSQWKDMQAANDYVGRDLITNMGDILTLGYTDKEQPLINLVRFGKDFTQNHGRVPIAIVRGNHDDNCYGPNNGSQEVNYGVDAIITPQEWHTILARHSYPDAVFPDGVSDANYFYIDNEHSKVRIVVLDTQDVPMILADENTWKYNSYNCSCVSNAQLNFVADALQMDGKANPDDWAVLFISHIPMDTSKADGERMGITDSVIRGISQFWGIVDAYRNGTTYSFDGTDTNEDFPYSISADYSAKGAGEVIALLAGHTHSDNTSDAVGTSDSLSQGYRFITISEFGYADVVVDRDAHDIHVCKRLGRAGYRYRLDAGAIDGLADSGDGYNAVDSYGDYVTTWTTY